MKTHTHIHLHTHTHKHIQNTRNETLISVSVEAIVPVSNILNIYIETYRMKITFTQYDKYFLFLVGERYI